MRGLLSILILSAGVACAYHPSYDHQTVPYTPKYVDPVSVTGDVTASPFFSPDSAIQTLVELIQNAPQNGWIDIGTPGWDSWNSCSYGDDDSGNCVGCTISEMKEDTFPVFPAVLNAIHERNVSVRIVTNNYNSPTCAGKIAPLDFLALNGAEIRYYATTTFYHAKYLAVGPPSGGSAKDRKAAISSINFSHASIMANREAGVVVTAEGDGAKLVELPASAFGTDFYYGWKYNVTVSYTKAELAEIQDPSPYPVVLPPQPKIPGAYITPPLNLVPYTDVSASVFIGPGATRDQMLAKMNASTTSFQLFIYQITDPGLTSALLKLHRNGVNVTLLVSEAIYSAFDRNAAKEQYMTLFNAGLTPRLTPSYYTYSHQKLWISDDTDVTVFTGNWSPTDAAWPVNGVFPPYPDPNWQDVNRDMGFQMNGPNAKGFVKIFQDTFNADWQRGTDFTPNWMF